jgi:TonB family protein
MTGESMKYAAPTMILVISLLVTAPAQAQKQSPELAEADQLSAQVITLYQERKYDTALPLAQRALELREKVLGPDHQLTGDAAANLAAVYMAMDNRKKAKPYLERAIAIREKDSSGDKAIMVRLLERYMCLQAGEGQKDKTAEVRLRLFKLQNGIDYDKSAHTPISLPAPSYPREARANKISGTVVTRVTVDETGKVIDAKVLCGDPILVKGIGSSVWSARFKPRTASGGPSKLIDLLVYNFVAY